MLFAHARQSADFSLARQLLDAIHVAHFIGAPDQRNRLRPETLNLQQLQHGGVILFEQLDLHRQLAVVEQFLQVLEHPLSNAWNGQHLLGFTDNFLDLLRVVFDGLGGIAIGTDPERVLPVNF